MGNAIYPESLLLSLINTTDSYKRIPLNAEVINIIKQHKNSDPKLYAKIIFQCKDYDIIITDDTIDNAEMEIKLFCPLYEAENTLIPLSGGASKLLRVVSKHIYLNKRYLCNLDTLYRQSFMEIFNSNNKLLVNGIVKRCAQIFGFDADGIVQLDNITICYDDVYSVYVYDEFSKVLQNWKNK